MVIGIRGFFRLIFRDGSYLSFYLLKQIEMIEVSLFGIVLGLIPITLAGLFVTAYLQYRRGDQLDLWLTSIFSRLTSSLQEVNREKMLVNGVLLSFFIMIQNKINGSTLCRIWTYDIGFWRPAFYRTELRALSYDKNYNCKEKYFFFFTPVLHTNPGKKWKIMNALFYFIFI